MDTTGKSRFLIAVGSNLGDRAAAIEAATQAIAARLGPVTARAPVYETPPALAATQVFLNTALVCESALDAESAMRALLAIEAALGRVRRERWGDRVIDLDLLLWLEAGRPACTAHVGELATLPHPRMLERDFVLVPAADAAPEWRAAAGAPSLGELRAAKGWTLKLKV